MARTRGERSNNPGNLVKGPRWRGLTQPQPETRFAQFTLPEWGIRALAKDVLNDYNRKGKRTVAALISEYAPAEENETGAYISAVARKLGVEPAEEINLNERATLLAFVVAVIHQENGRVIYTAEQLGAAVDGALGVGPYA